jgi:hypothetical protein
MFTGDNNVDIGNQGVAGESNTIRIGTVVPFTDTTGLVHPAHTATYMPGSVVRPLLVALRFT